MITLFKRIKVIMAPVSRVAASSSYHIDSYENLISEHFLGQFALPEQFVFGGESAVGNLIDKMLPDEEQEALKPPLKNLFTSIIHYGSKPEVSKALNILLDPRAFISQENLLRILGTAHELAMKFKRRDLLPLFLSPLQGLLRKNP